MRRIALTLALLATAAVTVAATAGADDKRTYQAELFNAFGLVEGSELRIAGVKAGTITDLDVTAEKTALLTFEVGPGFPELKADASCSSEPQSLIAEYFLDCQPGTSDQPLEGPIAAAQQPDHRPERPRQQHPPRALQAPLPAAHQRVRDRPGRGTPRT